MNVSAPTGALAGLIVIDLTRVLGGPFCTQWLGDHGADVIKVEPPQGDEVRQWGPPFDKHGTSSYFLGVNRSKRGMSLDLREEAGRAILMKLLENADIMVENFKIGTLNKWGMDYESVLKERFPRLIHCRITGFGADGPLAGLPGYDAVVQAMAGWLSINGTAESGPTRLGIPMVDIGAGLSAGFGILAALYERERSGRGQFLEVSLYDAAVSMLFPHGSNWFVGGKRPQLQGNQHPNIAPYDTFATKTGDVFIGVGNDRQFSRLVAALGKPELATDQRFTTMHARNDHRPELKNELESLLASHDGEEICETLMKAGVPAGPVLEVPEVVKHPHTLHRNMIVDIGDYRGLGNPVKLSRTPPRPTKAPPRFGEDTRDVLAEAGIAADEIEALLASGIVSALSDEPAET